MLQTNLASSTASQSQILPKNKLNNRSQHKQRVLIHHSFKNTQILHPAEGNLRSNSSEARYGSRSLSIQKPMSSSRKKPIRTVLSPQKQKIKEKQTQNARIRYYREQNRQQAKLTDKTADLGHGSNPWGGPNIARGLSPSKNSRQRLQEQRKALERLTEIKKPMQEQRGLKASSVIKYKGTKKVSEVRLGKRPLPDYLQFIKAQGSYGVGFDFGYLRNLTRAQAEQIVDFGSYRVLESIFLCILDVVRANGKLPLASALKLLKEYSLLYFRFFEKILTQFVLYHHIFKLVQPSIISFLLHSRLCIIYLYETSALQCSLNEKCKPLIESAFSKIVQITKLLLLQGQGEPSKGSDHVISTFRYLQDTNRIEKEVTEFITVCQRIWKIIDGNGRTTAIVKQFEPLLKEAYLRGCQLEYLAQTECVIGWKFYGIPPIPYLPRKSLSKPYTLVLALNYTLAFFDPHSRMVRYRPYLDLFLEKVSQLFELVIWAHQEKLVADLIIDSIERGTIVFSARLYCEHYSLVDGIMGRDLTRLGRPTETTILLDVKKQNIEKRAKSAERGVIRINPFLGDHNDSQLLRMANRLKWMTDGLPETIVDRVPLHLDTLEHIEQVLDQNNTLTLSTH